MLSAGKGPTLKGALGRRTTISLEKELSPFPTTQFAY
jgi:hypothetical protein